MVNNIKPKWLSLVAIIDKMVRCLKKTLTICRRKENLILFGWLIDGYTKKYTLTYIKQIEMPVGTLNGTGQSLVSLQSMVLVNIMVGIVTVGMFLIINQMI